MKAAVNVRLFALLTPFNPGEVHLNALSEKPLPPQSTPFIPSREYTLSPRSMAAPALSFEGMAILLGGGSAEALANGALRPKPPPRPPDEWIGHRVAATETALLSGP